MTMKVTELRVENLVKYDGRIFRIHSLAEEYPTLDTTEFGIGVVDWNNLNPVELTEEWLLKLGFKSNPYIDMYELGCFDIYCDKTSGILRLWCEINDRIVELKTVHHLQNLYFAITGEELELKLKT